MNNQSNWNMLCFLVQAFVNGIGNRDHKQLIKIILLNDIYIYNQAKTTAEKVIISVINPIHSSTLPTQLWMTVSAQPVE